MKNPCEASNNVGDDQKPAAAPRPPEKAAAKKPKKTKPTVGANDIYPISRCEYGATVVIHTFLFKNLTYPSLDTLNSKLKTINREVSFVNLCNGVGCDKEKKIIKEKKKEYNQLLDLPKTKLPAIRLMRTNKFLDIDADKSVEESDDIEEEELNASEEDDDNDVEMGEKLNSSDEDDNNVDMGEEAGDDNFFQVLQDEGNNEEVLQELRGIVEKENKEIKLGFRNADDRTVNPKNLAKLLHQQGHHQSSKTPNEAANSTSASALESAGQDELDNYKTKTQAIHGSKIFKDKKVPKKISGKSTELVKNDKEKNKPEPMNETSEVHEAEEIVAFITPTASSKSSKEGLFEVKWEGYSSSENTLEPRSNLTGEELGELCVFYGSFKLLQNSTCICMLAEKTHEYLDLYDKDVSVIQFIPLMVCKF